MNNEIIDITDWNAQDWVSTGGTRSKKYVQAPDGKFYYFKRSYKTEGRDYFFEFWSEIIATQIGTSLGFDMLKYVPAIDGAEMGCLSESMIKSDSEELIEIGKYMTALENRFQPDFKEGRRLYTFDLIEKTFEAFDKDEHLDRVVEHIIFDCLIGNGDRHQENWAFITEITWRSAALTQIEIAAKEGVFEDASSIFSFLGLDKFIKSIVNIDLKKLKPEANFARLYLQKTQAFAPIFDSGSSLGRELSENKITEMLKDEVQFNAYINRGISEIHWDNKKVSHYQLIEKLLATSYQEIVLNTINRVRQNFDRDNIQRIIHDIDKCVPDSHARFRLSANRKQLIYKLVTSRYEKLIALGNGGV